MAIVKIENVWKKYGEVEAVKDLNLECRDGEFLSLLGPSGCGKSFTSRMMAGLEKITKGEMYIRERLVNDLSPKDRGIAMVFEDYALYPHMTVFENMAFPLKIRGFSCQGNQKQSSSIAKIGPEGGEEANRMGSGRTP